MYTKWLPIIKHNYTQIFVLQLCPRSAQEQTEKINSRAGRTYLCISLLTWPIRLYIYIYVVYVNMYVYIAYIKRNYVLFNNFIINLTHSLSLQRQRWQMRQNGASFRQVNLVTGLRLRLVSAVTLLIRRVCSLNCESLIHRHEKVDCVLFGYILVGALSCVYTKPERQRPIKLAPRRKESTSY